MRTKPFLPMLGTLLAFLVAFGPAWGQVGPGHGSPVVREAAPTPPFEICTATFDRNRPNGWEIPARELAVACQATHSLARRALHPLDLKHLQIRNALAETDRYAQELANEAASPEVTLKSLRFRMSRISMWANTAALHLAEAKNSKAIQKVREHWVNTERLWKSLESQLGQGFASD